MWFSSWVHNRKRSHSGQPSRTQRSSPGKRATFRPRLEALEDRWLPSTLTVLNNLDSGPGSLRAAIAVASSGDTINFANSLKGQTITLTSGQLAITTNLDIEGLGANKPAVSGNGASRVFDIAGGERDHRRPGDYQWQRGPGSRHLQRARRHSDRDRLCIPGQRGGGRQLWVRRRHPQ